MKEGIFDITLMYRLVFRNIDAKNSTNGGWLDNSTKRVTKIKTGLLRKSLSNKATFIMLHVSVSIKFVRIKPMTYHNIGMHGFGNKIPCVFRVQSRHFLIHGSMLIWITHNLISGARNKGDIRGHKKIKYLPRFYVSSMRSGSHWIGGGGRRWGRRRA